MEDGGFYLLHSTPNFPDVPADDVYHGTRSFRPSVCVAVRRVHVKKACLGSMLLEFQEPVLVAQITSEVKVHAQSNSQV